MDALGMIETKGLLAAIESADAMLKAAEVRLLERDFVGGGLVTVMVKGDVAAVKASIDAAAAAVNRIDPSLLISQHVIPRPHEELGDNVISTVPLCELHEEICTDEKAEEAPLAEAEVDAEAFEPTEPDVKAEVLEKAETLVEVVETPEAEVAEEPEAELETAEEAPDAETKEVKQVHEESSENAAEMHKADMDHIVEKHGLEKALEVIGGCKVIKLRNLAREYEDFGISGRVISKANKTTLLEEFRKYYTK